MEKYIFISGATSGIGKACAYLYAKENWNIILCGRRIDRLLAIKEEVIEKFGVHVEVLQFDVRSEAKTFKVISSLDENVLENIEIVINNAGLALGRGPIDEGEISDWNQMIDTNIKGLLYVTKAILPYFKKKSSGHFVNIASVAGKEVYPGGNIYCATKHAVDALSRSMRIDLAPYGIKVSNIAPGAVHTEFSLVRYKGNEATAESVYHGFDPLLAEDIAESIFFVTSRPKHVTINDITIMPTAQASTQVLIKK